jgi:hypothetical protein
MFGGLGKHAVLLDVEIQWRRRGTLRMKWNAMHDVNAMGGAIPKEEVFIIGPIGFWDL